MSQPQKKTAPPKQQAEKPKLRAAADPQGDASPRPVLEISTIAPVRPYITVDGDAHELAVMGDFGIADQQALSRDGGEFVALFESPDELEEHQQARLKMLLDRMFVKVLSGEVGELLGDEARAQVVLGFLYAPQRRALAEMERTIDQMKPGESSTTAS